MIKSVSLAVFARNSTEKMVLSYFSITFGFFD